jgi:hypothetical protein
LFKGWDFFHHRLVVFNKFNKSSSELLAIFLFIHEEGVSNQVFKVEGDGSILISTLRVLAGLDLSIVDVSLRVPLWVGLSPPDMQACTLSSSGLQDTTRNNR